MSRLAGWMAAAVSLACHSCSKEAVSTDPPETIAPAENASNLLAAARSTDGRVLVEVARTGAACLVRATKDDRELWSSDACVAKAEDLLFVSNDGEHLVVLHLLPKLEGGWVRAPAVELFEKSNAVLAIPAGALVRQGERLRLTSKRFHWVAGVLGVPGLPPRQASEGEGIVVHIIDGTTRTIAFDRAAMEPGIVTATKLLAETPRLAAQQGGGFFTWEDDAGSVHFASEISEVPKKFRKRVRHTYGGEIAITTGGIRPTSSKGSDSVTRDRNRAIGVRNSVYILGSEFVPSDESRRPADYDSVCRGLTIEECQGRISSGSNLGKWVASEAEERAKTRAEAERRRKEKADEEGWARQREAARHLHFGGW